MLKILQVEYLRPLLLPYFISARHWWTSPSGDKPLPLAFAGRTDVTCVLRPPAGRHSTAAGLGGGTALRSGWAAGASGLPSTSAAGAAAALRSGVTDRAGSLDIWYTVEAAL